MWELAFAGASTMVTRVGLYTLCYQDSYAAEENSWPKTNRALYYIYHLALLVFLVLDKLQYSPYFQHYTVLTSRILSSTNLSSSSLASQFSAYQLYLVYSSTLFYSHLGWHYALLRISGISFCKPQLHRRICMCICTLYELEQKRVQDAVVGPGCKFLMAGMPIWHIWLKWCICNYQWLQR